MKKTPSSTNWPSGSGSAKTEPGRSSISSRKIAKRKSPLRRRAGRGCRPRGSQFHAAERIAFAESGAADRSRRRKHVVLECSFALIVSCRQRGGVETVDEIRTGGHFDPRAASQPQF